MEKDHGVKSGGNQTQVSPSFLPVESHEMHKFLQQQIVTLVKCSLPESCVETQSLEFFIGKGSHGILYLKCYQNSRLPEGKQVFRINHIVCTV